MNRAEKFGEFGELPGVEKRAGESDAIFEMNVERHDMRFAQRVDGRVRDLGEPLFAVVPERARKSGKKSGRGVVTHAPVGFFAVDERREKSFELVFGPAAAAMRLGSLVAAPGVAAEKA